jgi:hypothetical protein
MCRSREGTGGCLERKEGDGELRVRGNDEKLGCTLEVLDIGLSTARREPGLDAEAAVLRAGAQLVLPVHGNEQTKKRSHASTRRMVLGVIPGLSSSSRGSHLIRIGQNG